MAEEGSGQPPPETDAVAESLIPGLHGTVACRVHFFVSYNQERGRTFRPLGRFGVQRAKALIQRGERLFKKEKKQSA